MHRIDTPTAQKDKFGAGKNGYTDGNPQVGTPATDLNAAMFDAMQEEICGVIESQGIVLATGDNGQLLKALQAMLTTFSVPDVGDLYFTKGGTDPNVKYPGTTWLRVAEGVTMRSAKADGSDLGTVVGSDTATLAVENLPAHAHNIGGSTGSGGSATITSGAYDFASISTSNTGAHTHTYTYMADTGDSGENDSDGTPITKSSTGTTSSSGAHAHTVDLPSHTHSVSVPAHTHTLPAATQNAGGGTAFNIIPHSMIVNIWERTA